MRAVVFNAYGPPEMLKVRDVPKPEPKDDEVLVKVHASVATPSDCASRSGTPFAIRLFIGLLKPKVSILGDTLAGEIEAVGKDVREYAVGDQVVGSTNVSMGAYAEFKCLPEDGGLAPKPPELNFGEAAGLAEGILTALPFLRDHARLQRGQTILINGAAGNVGSTAVQLAKHMGAVVTGVCGAGNVDLVRSLGADRVIDYGREGIVSDGPIYDVIFDAVGKSSFAKCKPGLKPQGVYLTTVPSLGGMVQMLLTSRGRGQRAIFAATGLRKAAEKKQDLLVMRDLVDAGAIRPVIDSEYPMDRIVEAHRRVESGHKAGSVVVQISSTAAA